MRRPGLPPHDGASGARGTSSRVTGYHSAIFRALEEAARSTGLLNPRPELQHQVPAYVKGGAALGPSAEAGGVGSERDENVNQENVSSSQDTVTTSPVATTGCRSQLGPGGAPAYVKGGAAPGPSAEAGGVGSERDENTWSAEESSPMQIN